jgi:hypothetical protein
MRPSCPGPAPRPRCSPPAPRRRQSPPAPSTARRCRGPNGPRRAPGSPPAPAPRRRSPRRASPPTARRDSWLGLAFGSLLSIAGISLAYYLYIVAPGSTDRIRARFSHVHQLLFNKWYFDEIQDALVYRPVKAVGRFANDTFERYVVQGLVVFFREGVGGLGDSVRTLQSGFIRSYSLLLIAGIAGLALYFLIRAA